MPAADGHSFAALLLLLVIQVVLAENGRVEGVPGVALENWDTIPYSYHLILTVLSLAILDWE